MKPSPSAQNPISQPLKKANPNSHFTPSRPSQKAFFDTVVEYSTCKYLGNYLNGKHNRHTTWYLSLKGKKCYVKLLLKASS